MSSSKAQGGSPRRSRSGYVPTLAERVLYKPFAGGAFDDAPLPGFIATTAVVMAPFAFGYALMAAVAKLLGYW